MDIRDVLVGDRAGMLEGAVTHKAVYDAHVKAGFKPKDALEILKAMITQTMANHSETEFSERLARGEFDGN